MPITNVYEVTCASCKTETTVAEHVWPATRTSPAEGELGPEECPSCGKPFDQEDEWKDSEPPEPDHHQDDYDWEGP
jgi:hypothetical protein